MKKVVLWLVLGGMVYYAIEGLWRIPSNGGWANVAMLFVGGLCFVLIGSLNQLQGFYHRSMPLQALAGAVIVLAVEFASGCVLNLWLGMGIWDYSRLPLNVMGQVCLPYGILWFLLMPFAIWLEDRLNLVWWKAFGGAEPEYDYSLGAAYRELFGVKVL